MNTSIFVAYREDRNRLCGGMFTPIHSGRAAADEETKKSLSDMIGDDTGDNISSSVGFFGNLTSLYWAWKNSTSDMIGFFDSRRHLAFGSNLDKENTAGFVEYPCVSKHYADKYGLNNETIVDTIGRHELVIGNKWNVSNGLFATNREAVSVFSGLTECHDAITEIIRNCFPDFAEDVDKYDDSTNGCYSNLFVMRKELLNRYCSVLFDVLFGLRDRNLLTEVCVAESVSQYILGIFVLNYMRTTGKEPLELQKIFITYPDNYKGYIQCHSICDDNYAPYLGVFMTSVKLNKGDEKICFWVLSDCISEINKTRLMRMSSDDFKVIILEFELSNENVEKAFKFNHWSRSTFSRLYMPDYVPSYVKKMIVFDPDMICRGSVKPLYDESLDGYWVSGVKDTFSDSCQKRLGVDKYICDGMMLADFDALRANNMVEVADKYITDNWNNKTKLTFADQDVINSILSGKIKYADNKWDALTSPESYSSEQNEIGKTSIIVHFTGNKKPWLKNNGNPFADEYYSYLEKSYWADMPRYTGTLYRFIRRYFRNWMLGSLSEHKLDKKAVFAIKTDMGIGNAEDIMLVFNRCRKWDDFSVLTPLFEQQAKKGNNHARRCLSAIYRDGIGTEKQMRRSFIIFKQIVDSGLGWMCTSICDRLPDYFDDAIMEKDPDYQKDVFTMLLSYSDERIRCATACLAKAHLYGIGTEANRDKALDSLKAINVLDNICHSSVYLDVAREFGDSLDEDNLSVFRKKLRRMIIGD